MVVVDPLGVLFKIFSNEGKTQKKFRLFQFATLRNTNFAEEGTSEVGLTA